MAKGIALREKPSEEDVRDHMRTHVPFRSWCRHCIKGAGQAGIHRAQKDAERAEGSVPVVSLDYMWMED